MTTYWCEFAWAPGGLARGVRADVRGDRIAGVESGRAALPGDVVLPGVTFPGLANAHSHLFHRFLRGRTHSGGGTFWTWREEMYALAGRLTPESYRLAAHAVFAEMLSAGYTAVGEFHYLHHRPGGAAYPAHDMELAVVDAAEATGIRLTLLDTCYLAGGFGLPLEPGQRRFGDGDAAGWLRRWLSLREAVGERPLVRLGAALHSVRAVPEEALALVARELPADVPLHIHLSEQEAENSQCLAAHGVTPTGLLLRTGLLERDLGVVHATHLSDADREVLGAAGATVVMCPSTEADLADGIGPARELLDAGGPIALGSDQNAVVDPMLEARGLEAGERLGSGRRGRFAPGELATALTAAGYRTLAWDGGRLEAGALCDLVTVRLDSPRTAGVAPEQVMFAATSADVSHVVVGGRATTAHDAAALLAEATMSMTVGGDG